MMERFLKTERCSALSIAPTNLDEENLMNK